MLLRAFNNLILANQTESSQAVPGSVPDPGLKPYNGPPPALFYEKIRGLQNLLTQISPPGIE